MVPQFHYLDWKYQTICVIFKKFQTTKEIFMSMQDESAIESNVVHSIQDNLLQVIHITVDWICCGTI